MVKLATERALLENNCIHEQLPLYPTKYLKSLEEEMEDEFHI